VSFAAITTYLSPFGNRFKSAAPIEAKILQRYAMITAPAARRRGADLPRDLNYAFIIGNLSGESLLKILRMALSSMTNSVSSHTGSGKLKGSSCRCEIAMRVGSRFVLPRTRLIADGFALAAPLRIFLKHQRGNAPRF